MSTSNAAYLIVELYLYKKNNTVGMFVNMYVWNIYRDSFWGYNISKLRERAETSLEILESFLFWLTSEYKCKKQNEAINQGRIYT